jgi:hypothetical protein
MSKRISLLSIAGNDAFLYIAEMASVSQVHKVEEDPSRNNISKTPA